MWGSIRSLPTCMRDHGLPSGQAGRLLCCRAYGEHAYVTLQLQTRPSWGWFPLASRYTTGLCRHASLWRRTQDDGHAEAHALVVDDAGLAAGVRVPVHGRPVGGARPVALVVAAGTDARQEPWSGSTQSVCSASMSAWGRVACFMQTWYP